MTSRQVSLPPLSGKRAPQGREVSAVRPQVEGFSFLRSWLAAGGLQVQTQDFLNEFKVKERRTALTTETGLSVSQMPLMENGNGTGRQVSGKGGFHPILYSFPKGNNLDTCFPSRQGNDTMAPLGCLLLLGFPD